MTAGGRPVRVAVEAVADRPERTFTYLLPAALGDVAPGSLLLVPYGRRLALGYLLDGEPEPGAELKDVEAVVSEPMLTGELLDLATEIAVYYRAPIGTTLAAMLPPGLESRLLRRWFVVDAARLPPELADLAGDGGRDQRCGAPAARPEGRPRRMARAPAAGRRAARRVVAASAGGVRPSRPHRPRARWRR